MKYGVPWNISPLSNNNTFLYLDRTSLIIDALLEAGNLKRDNILKCSIFLKDMNDFNKVNEIYGSFFNKPYPSRETVEVARLPKDANIEISFIAGE